MSIFSAKLGEMQRASDILFSLVPDLSDSISQINRRGNSLNSQKGLELNKLARQITACSSALGKERENIEKIRKALDKIIQSIIDGDVEAAMHISDGKGNIELIDFRNRVSSVDISSLTGLERKLLESLWNNMTIHDGMTEEEKRIRDMFIEEYEKEHSKEKEKIETFFSNCVDGFTDEDIANIKAIAYRSKGNCHELFFKYIDQCKVVDFHSTVMDENGNPIPQSFYSNQQSKETNGIHLNIDKNSLIADKRGAYITIFHEIGHNIDDLICSDDKNIFGGIKKANNFTDTINNGNFNQTIYNDVKNNIRTTIDKNIDRYIETYYTEWKDENVVTIAPIVLGDVEKERIVSALLDGRHQYELNPVEKYIYDQAHSDYAINYLNGSDNNMISDIYGGSTNNSTSGSFVHNLTDSQKYGYSDSYWYDTQGNPTHMQEQEFFAHYFSYEMTHDKDEAHAREFLPNSFNAMDEAVASYLKNN